MGVTDPFGDLTRYVYDAAGRRTRVRGTSGLHNESGQMIVESGLRTWLVEPSLAATDVGGLAMDSHGPVRRE